MPPPPKPLASQADFDEAVATNVEDFDMSRSEAVVAALEELRLQVRFFFFSAFSTLLIGEREKRNDV